MRLSDRIRELFSTSKAERLFAVPRPDGLQYLALAHPPDDEHWHVESVLALAALDELCASGPATEQTDGFHIEWDNVYALLADEEHADAASIMQIPTTGNLRPRLRSSNALDDVNFEVAIDGWLDKSGRVDATRLGGVARTSEGLQLLPYSSFELSNAVGEFWSDDVRTPESNRYHWGRIRKLAVQASAGLDQFLAGTIVLTPEKLQIRLEDANVADSSVVEVQPWFTGAPDSWLYHFDRAQNVRDLYQIVTDEGLIEILVTPKVKTVLRAIKGMPGRRTAGAAAERFLHNPFAALGPDAVDVLDEEQFDEARHEAGIEFERFTCKITVEEDRVTQVGVIVERLTEQSGESAYERFKNPADLRAFIAKVQSRLETGSQLCEWRRHRLELTGDTNAELQLLRTALLEWLKQAVMIKALDVLDLKRYSDRVSGIGIQPRIVSPYIPIQSGEDPWFPEAPIAASSAVAVSVPIDNERDLELLVDKRVYQTLQNAAREAESAGRDTISIPGHSDAVPLAAAKAVVEQLESHFGVTRTPTGRKPAPTDPKPKGSKERQELLLRANIDQSEFAEERAKELGLFPGVRPQLPSCLKETVCLLEHQKSGIAWLQNLFGKSPQQCRGAVLADDMGLGKTLQLLTLICWAIEQDPQLEPVLIVAPVSLLENWKEEAEKFFGQGRPRMLTLYGSALESLRAH